MKTSSIIALLGIGGAAGFAIYYFNKKQEIKESTDLPPNVMSQDLKNLISKNESKKSMTIRNLRDSRLDSISYNKKIIEKDFDFSTISKNSQSYEAEKEHIIRGGTTPNYIDSSCNEAWIILLPGESAVFPNEEYVVDSDVNKNTGSPYIWDNPKDKNLVVARKVGYVGGIWSIKYSGPKSIETLKETIDLNTKCRLKDYLGDDMMTGVKRNKDY